MSDNKGREGELMVLGVLNDASIALGGLEPLRHSSTNTADMGVDITLIGSKSDMETVISIGEGQLKNPSETGVNTLPDNTRVKARIDVKNYDGKITKAAMDKFIGEVSILPDYDFHIMAGANGMMRGAQKSFDNAKAMLTKHGKGLHYMDNQGIYNLSQAFPPTRPTNPQELKAETDYQQNVEEENKP